MEKNTPTGYFWLIVIIALLAGGLAGAAFFASETVVEVPGETEIVRVEVPVIEYRDVPVVETEGVESDSSFVLNKNEFEDEAIEAMAEEMALAELTSRDFKKAVFAALEAYEVDIDSYKDITDIKVMDVDVDDDEVSLDLKITYFLDEDEDEVEKARLNEFTITVEDLDFDENFEDAEVNEDYLDTLTVRKVYD